MFEGINKEKLVSSILVLCMVFLVSCGEPKIDVSSNKAIQLSIEKIRESLSIDQLALFNSSLRIITIKYSTLHKKSNDKFLDIIDGKTGLEIIAEAEKIRRSKQ